MSDHDRRYLQQWGHRIDLGGPCGRVHADLYDAVRHQVEFMLPTLQRGRAYTTRQICNEGFWDRIGTLEARQAGMCLRDMVNRGVVPLTSVRRKSTYPKRYQLK